jgi:signal transduction histidine kinase
VDLHLTFGDEALDMVVSNPVPGARSTEPPTAAREGGGRGLAGMRERAALLGGSLEAGVAGGAFRVHTRLPYGERTHEQAPGAPPPGGSRRGRS